MPGLVLTITFHIKIYYIPNSLVVKAEVFESESLSSNPIQDLKLQSGLTIMKILNQIFQSGLTMWDGI